MAVWNKTSETDSAVGHLGWNLWGNLVWLWGWGVQAVKQGSVWSLELPPMNGLWSLPWKSLVVGVWLPESHKWSDWVVSLVLTHKNRPPLCFPVFYPCHVSFFILPRLPYVWFYRVKTFTFVHCMLSKKISLLAGVSLRGQMQLALKFCVSYCMESCGQPCTFWGEIQDLAIFMLERGRWYFLPIDPCQPLDIIQTQAGPGGEVLLFHFWSCSSAVHLPWQGF